MQIITGKYRARKLVSPAGEETRPTLARIKESIFSILPLSHEGYVTLDLFAGSGASGLESLSRGAKSVYLVDQSGSAIKAIETNSRNMKEDIHVMKTDCFSALNEFVRLGVKFDLIFLDPPYASDLGEKCIAFIESHDLLNGNGKIVYEHNNLKKSLPKLLKRYIIEKTREYKEIVVDFISSN